MSSGNLIGLADDLGMVRAQIAELKNREAKLRATIIEAGERVLEDDLFRATLIEQTRKTIDWKAVAEKLNPTRQLIRAHTTEQTVQQVKTSSRRGNDAS